MEKFRCDRTESEKAWLLRIAINTCNDYRRGMWLRRIDLPGEMEKLPPPLISVLPEEKDLFLDIMRMPAKYRHIILLKYYQNLTLREMGEILGLSLSVIHHRLKKAEEIVRKALDEKYPITLDELEALKTCTTLYAEQDGSHEYYIEFIGYEYSEQLARIWSYAARVNSETGEVLAAVKRDEWNQITGRKLVPDASHEMERLIWEHEMQDALRRSAGDDSGNGWNLNYNGKGEYFYNWTPGEKAAYSQKIQAPDRSVPGR